MARLSTPPLGMARKNGSSGLGKPRFPDRGGMFAP
jgi:hypothetical protein